MDIRKYEAMVKLGLTDIKIDPDYFNKLDAVDVTGIEPLVSVLDITNVMREDIVVKEISRDELLENAPEQYGGYFQVPRTVEA